MRTQSDKDMICSSDFWSFLELPSSVFNMKKAIKSSKEHNSHTLIDAMRLFALVEEGDMRILVLTEYVHDSFQNDCRIRNP